MFQRGGPNTEHSPNSLQILAYPSSAYRKQHSCESTLIGFVEEWRKALDIKEKVYLLAMDMSKPFDSLHHSLTLAKLNTGGFSDTGSLDLRWPEPIYIRVGYVFDLRHRKK